MDNDPRSLPKLLVNAVDEFVQLATSEIAVARAEVAEKASQATSGAIMLVVALVLLIPVTVVVLLAFATWLIEVGLRPSLAHVCAGILGLAVVGILALTGKAKLAPGNLALRHTSRELRRNRRAATRLR